MQVNSIQNIKNNTNFKSLNKIEIEGLYKEHPEFAIELLKAFKQHPVAKKFCNRFDVDLLLYAGKNKKNTHNHFFIFYYNPTDNEATRNIKRDILNKGKILNVKHSDSKDGLRETTISMIRRILPKDMSIENFVLALKKRRMTKEEKVAKFEQDQKTLKELVQEMIRSLQ